MNKSLTLHTNSGISHKKHRFRRLFQWNRTSYGILSLFLLTVSLIIVIWWPLAEEQLSYWVPGIPWWWQIDWLLIGNFLVMSLLIMAGADLKHDVWIAAVGLAGGLAIEGWGTQTELWTYYTGEAPPLWIIPAWPIANLAINRIVRFLRITLPKQPRKLWVVLYWIIFPIFLTLMLPFVWPTIHHPLTILATLACILITISPTNHRTVVLTFVGAICLGYFLELWGTTRLCWTYHTETTTPIFTILAHGMAAVSVWKVIEILQCFKINIVKKLKSKTWSLRFPQTSKPNLLGRCVEGDGDGETFSKGVGE